MGRNVVEATNAWRMRRTRGDIGLFVFVAAARVEAAWVGAVWVGVVPDFLSEL